MKKIYYEKVGRRFVPIAEYDSDYLDSFPQGNHLVMCYPGGVSRRYNIDPNYAAMIAAGRVAEDAICSVMVKASEYRPEKTPITPEQKAAWDNLARAFGQEFFTLYRASVREIVDAGIRAMQAEADKLMKNEGVRKAYDHFELMCKLAKENDDV